MSKVTSLVAAAVMVATLFLGASGVAVSATPTLGLAPTQAPAIERPIRIMELGDSITAGVAAGGGPDPRAGYRAELAVLLQDGGHRFLMVGSRDDYSGGRALGHHEGWPGYVLRSYPPDPTGQLYGPLVHDAIVEYRPDIVLLMAGTNDLLRYERHDAGYTLPYIKHSMDLVLGQIFTLDPHVHVIVAGVVNSPKVDEAAVLSFDDSATDGLVALVAKYRSFGHSIDLAAGMDRAVPRTSLYFPDGIHPSGADGYDRVATIWYRALVQILPATSGSVASAAKQTNP